MNKELSYEASMVAGMAQVILRETHRLAKEEFNDAKTRVRVTQAVIISLYSSTLYTARGDNVQKNYPELWDEASALALEAVKDEALAVL
jgi:hypothetical protein